MTGGDSLPVFLSSEWACFEDGRAFTPGLSSGRYLFEDGKAFTPGLSSGRYLFEDGKEIPDRVRNDEQSGGPVSGKKCRILPGNLLEGVGALEHEVRAEVFGADLIIGGKGFRGTALENVALVEEVGTVDDGKGLPDIVVSDDYPDVLVLELGNDVLDVLHGNRVNAGERLIKEDELRVDCQCAGDFTAAAFSSGKLDAKTLADFVEAERTDA